jgi:hypothetical protein
MTLANICATTMDWKTAQKTDRFSQKLEKPVHWFFKYRLVKFELFKILKNEIKKSKKTRVYFKIFGQNIIQKLETTCPTKSIKV